MTLGNDNGTDGRTDRQTDRVRRNMRPPPREEGRIIVQHTSFGHSVRMPVHLSRFISTYDHMFRRKATTNGVANHNITLERHVRVRASAITQVTQSQKGNIVNV